MSRSSRSRGAVRAVDHPYLAVKASSEPVLGAGAKYRYEFLAVVVVNPGGTPREATLQPDASLAVREVRHYYLDGRTETRAPSSDIRLKLAAFDVQVVAFESQ